MKEKIKELLKSQPVVINIGAQEFAENLHLQGVDVIQVEWAPPTPLDQEMRALLEKLF